FLLDYQSIGYNGTMRGTLLNTPVSVNIDGNIRIYTPRANAVFNFFDGPITPYIAGGIGWSFVDPDLPEGPAKQQNVCWFDQWVGEVCTPYNNTRSESDFSYQLAAGVRWDFGGNLTMRFGYEKRWMDIGEATSSPDFDEIIVGVVYRY